MIHGTRACYKKGCRLLECRAAEASYRANLRQQHRTGKLPLGTTLSGREAAKRVKAFLRERWKRRDLAKATYVGRTTLWRFTQASRIRLRTLLKLRRGYRMLLTDMQTNETIEPSDAGA